MSVTQASLLGDTFGSNASGTIPVGGIIMWSGTTVPTGWALCNGSNGTPNLRNKFIVAADSLTKTGTTSQSGSSPYDPGDIGGASQVTLVENQIPSHTHTATDSGHIHALDYQTPLNITDVDRGNTGGGSVFSLDNSVQPSTVSGFANITVSSTGGNQPHENLPPYYALAFIMRVS